MKIVYSLIELGFFIEPILSGNLPPNFDSATCRSVYVGNIHPQVSEPLLQEVFLSTGPIEGCKLIKKDKSSYGFVHYFDRRSAALAIVTLNGRHLFGQPIKVNWAYASSQREDTDARVMWDQKTGRSRGFGFVSFRNQQDAQSAINDLNGKWLGSRQIRCNWAAKGATSNDDNAKSIVDSNGPSEEGQEKSNDDSPENNPMYTTVYVGNLAPEASILVPPLIETCKITRLMLLAVTSADLHSHFHALGAGTIEDVRVQRDKGFGFVRYSSHDEAALAIQMGNARILCSKPIKCSWGSKPTALGTSSGPLPPPTAAHMAGGAQVMNMMHPQGQYAVKAQAAMGMSSGEASQAMYNGGYQNVATSQQQLMYYQ
ncbi:hypothetical protein GOBAR_AA19203 [Gossypium barbadense]|uniref:RRM domain-containing protein n=1 Tax=Gossypium barbadense TaxID=3634 RepID=A0A2P5XDM4_GOSBA|nr:hypothetical protein GOBAR_AA19203 [Gossypium barbadense]